jgi:hypothetical protein
VTQGDPFFSGMLDESVLSKTSRSAAWIKLSYETQKTGATAVTVGSTTTPAAGGNDYTGLSGASASARTAFAATAAGRQVVFSLAAANAAGRVSVVDVQGRVLWTRTVDAGVASVAWDGRAGAGVAARGVYVARFETAKGVSIERKFAYNP